MRIPLAREDVVAKGPIEGRALSEGPLIVLTFEELIKKPDTQLVVLDKEMPAEARTKSMLVDSAKARDPQDISPETDATIDISPPEVSSVSKKVLSCLSQTPPLQLEVNRTPSYHLQSLT